MSRVDITQATVLERITARLRDQLGLSERQCYETLDPLSLPTAPKGGEYFVAVSPGDGNFQPGEQVSPNVTEEWNVTVTVYTRIALDSADHAEEILRNASRGLFPLKKAVLKALVGHDLLDASGNTFLRVPLYATRSPKPSVVERTGGAKTFLAVLSVDFGVDFDWDLT